MTPAVVAVISVTMVLTAPGDKESVNISNLVAGPCYCTATGHLALKGKVLTRDLSSLSLSALRRPEKQMENTKVWI